MEHEPTRPPSQTGLLMITAETTNSRSAMKRAALAKDAIVGRR
jgi:hypothetical protein